MQFWLNKFRAAQNARYKRNKRNARYREISREKQEFATLLRVTQTPAELAIEPYLTKLGFRSQVLLYGYIADFAHLRCRVLVEIDGSVHSSQVEYDHRRDEVFRSHEWKVFRFSNYVALNQPGAILRAVSHSLFSH